MTCLWSGWCPTMLPRAVTSTQPMPAKASSPTHPPLLLAGSKVPNGSGSADQVPAGVLPFRMRLTGDAGGCDVPLEWLVPHTAAQGRYVNPTNACQSFQPHPSTFAFSGFEGAKRHRLCRPSGNPLGLNPAGVLLFRMRAHRRRWGL